MSTPGGGQINEGLYYLAAKAIGETPLTFAQAQSMDPRQPFQYACSRLLSSTKVEPLFDYIFVDEAQDFPPSFLRLALRLAKEEKLVIAYDVFQTIFDVDIPTAEVIFGTKESGEPAVAFEEDTVLHKCYRNPLDILVCAHAIGFGIYSRKIVQMLESQAHWEDFGYKIESGSLNGGQQVTIVRPEENSPTSIRRVANGEPLISVRTFSEVEEEVASIAMDIDRDINREGLAPEDILVICADDRNAKYYFKKISAALLELNISTNDLQLDSFAIKNFSEKGRVTLSTIYKAKGNEAYEVFVVGIDALAGSLTARSRNTIFTAMTRAKGWLRVSGTGLEAKRFEEEAASAIRNLPRLVFEYPSQEQLVRIKRDLTEDPSAAVQSALDDVASELGDEEYERLLRIQLSKVRSRRLSGGRGRRKTPPKSPE